MNTKLLVNLFNAIHSMYVTKTPYIWSMCVDTRGWACLSKISGVGKEKNYTPTVQGLHITH